MEQGQDDRDRASQRNIYLRDEDDWSMSLAWRRFAVRAGARCGIVFVVATGVLWLLWPVLADVASQRFVGSVLGVFAIIAMVVGVPVGWLVARRVREGTGLEFRYAVAPLLAMLVGSEVGACLLAAWLRGGAPWLLLIPFSPLVLFSFAAALLAMIME